MKTTLTILFLIFLLDCQPEVDNSIVRVSSSTSLKEAPSSSEKTIAQIPSGTVFRKINNSEITETTSSKWIEVINEKYNGFILNSQIEVLKDKEITQSLPDIFYTSSCKNPKYIIKKIPELINSEETTSGKSTKSNSGIIISEKIGKNKRKFVTFDSDNSFSLNIQEEVRFIPTIKNFLAITEIKEDRNVNLLHFYLKNNIYSINLKHLIITGACESYDAYKFYEDDVPFDDYSLVVTEAPYGINIQFQKIKCSFKESKDILTTDIQESILTKVTFDGSSLILREYCYDGDFPKKIKNILQNEESLFRNYYKDYFL